jgi:hypothetical protein
MAVETKEVLKEHFQTGDKPTGNQFENLIDSIRHINDNEYGDFTTSGVISSSKGEGGGFGLKIHSASFNYISASTGDFDANTIRIGGSSFSKTNVDEVKDIETKRKSDIGIPMKRLRAFGSASTFVDLNAAGVVPSGHSSARSGFTKGESIDIFVKDTYEAFHVDPYLISVGAKANLPLELTGSLKISPSYSDPHDLKGKYKFSGNPEESLIYNSILEKVLTLDENLILPEQFDPTNNQYYSARKLTWNYSELYILIKNLMK